LENRQFVIEVNPERENGKIYSGMAWKINDWCIYEWNKNEL